MVELVRWSSKELAHSGDFEEALLQPVQAIRFVEEESLVKQRDCEGGGILEW